MRYLILVIMFFTIGCSEQKKQNINNNYLIDTAKQTYTNPQENKLVGQQAILCNCVMLEKEMIAASIECKKIQLQNDKELKEFLKKKFTDINKQKLYIIYSSNTSNKRIDEITNIVKEAKIYNYKVINLRSIFSLNEPIE